MDIALAAMCWRGGTCGVARQLARAHARADAYARARVYAHAHGLEAPVEDGVSPEACSSMA